MKKMRLLTFMQLAENSSEMAFDKVEKELQLGDNEVEEFIIDGKYLQLAINS
jgi:translation initiation factor 3 subunit M